MNGKRARAIRRLEMEQRAQRWARAPREVLDDVAVRLAAARAGGPGWQAAAAVTDLHLNLAGDAIRAQGILRHAAERMRRRASVIEE